jgi:hypothetical protein
MSYFANAIIENGQRYAVFPRSIGISESPDSDVVIGIASEVEWTEKDGPIWSLIIEGKAVEGLFVIAESEFVQFAYVSELIRPCRRAAMRTVRISRRQQAGEMSANPTGSHVSGETATRPPGA